MKLKTKILIWVVIITFALILSSALIVNSLLLDHISNNEENNACQEMESISIILEEMIHSEDVIATEWSHRDEICEFMENRNRGNINSVLVDETFINSGLDILIFVNRSGEIIFEKAFDQNQKKEILPSLSS